MKRNLDILNKWKWNGIVMIGGLLIGAGFADCLLAMNEIDLNRIARGLTIFSAGLTILVVMDNSKTQKKAESIQRETQLRLEKLETILQAIQQSQQHISEKQLQEMKQLFHTADVRIKHNEPLHTIHDVKGDNSKV